MNAMPSITLLSQPVVQSDDPDSITWNGNEYKKVVRCNPFKNLFKPTDDQINILTKIDRVMRAVGLNAEFVDDVIELANEDSGVYDLAYLWFKESDEVERRKIIQDLRNGLYDWGYSDWTLYEIYENKANTDRCYVVRQEIMDDRNVMQFEYWCEDMGWITSEKKGYATSFSRKEAIDMARNLRNSPSDGRVHVKFVKKAKPINQPAAQSEKVEDKKEYVIYCDHYQTYWSENAIPKWTTDKTKATLMTKSDAEDLVKDKYRSPFIQDNPSFKVMKADEQVSGLEIPALEESDHVIVWTNDKGDKSYLVRENVWSSDKTYAKRFSEKDANDYHTKYYDYANSRVQVEKLPKEAKQPEAEYDYVIRHTNPADGQATNDKNTVIAYEKEHK
jgi:hypothetical protein